MPECRYCHRIFPSRPYGKNLFCDQRCHGLDRAAHTNPVETFWSHVRQTPTCWLWTGGQQGTGYGSLWTGRKIVAAHRFAYELFVGPIPEGLFVCHHCDTKLCVRGSHLFVGTSADNMRDMAAKDRGSHAPRGIGEDNGGAKLTEADVLRIRASSATWDELAEEFGVNRMTIYRILHRKSWAHI